MERDFNIHNWQAKFILQEEAINYRNSNKGGETELTGNLEGVDQKYKDELDYALSLVKSNIEKGLKYHTNLDKAIANLSININEEGKVDCKVTFR